MGWGDRGDRVTKQVLGFGRSRESKRRREDVSDGTHLQESLHMWEGTWGRNMHLSCRCWSKTTPETQVTCGGSVLLMLVFFGRSFLVTRRQSPIDAFPALPTRARRPAQGGGRGGTISILPDLEPPRAAAVGDSSCSFVPFFLP